MNNISENDEEKALHGESDLKTKVTEVEKLLMEIKKMVLFLNNLKVGGESFKRINTTGT